jgi:hypothetical protein
MSIPVESPSAGLAARACAVIDHVRHDDHRSRQGERDPDIKSGNSTPFFNPDAHSTQVRSRFDLEIKISFGLAILIRHTQKRDGAAAISEAVLGDAVDKLAFVPSRGSWVRDCRIRAINLAKLRAKPGTPG